MGQGGRDAVEGITEEVKGMAKKLGGEITGNERMEREGEAQREKADAKRDAAKHEAEAEKDRGRAEIKEAEQRAHQD